MSGSNVTLASSYLRHIASFLEEPQVVPWLESAGLNRSDLDAGDLTISLRAFSRLLVSASEIAKEPALGLFLGQRLVARTHGFVGYAAIHSRSLREVLDVLESYVPLRVSILRLSRQIRGEEVRLVLHADVPLARVERPLFEAILMSLRNVLAAVSLGAFDVRALVFAFAEPAYGELARDVAGTNVVYGQSWTGLVLRTADLEAPLRTADPAVFEDAARICKRRMEELRARTSFADTVRHLLFSSENGFPSLQATAHRLHMTQRTLHRRLKAEGTSFRELLDDVRFRLAEDYLGSGHASLDEIAFMLGYSDPANFRRAFRRWAGVSPSVFRERLVSGTT